MTTSNAIIPALVSFASQRPGFDPRLYGNAATYRAETRAATADLHAVRELASVARYLCTDEELMSAAQGSRVAIEWLTGDNGSRVAIDYTTGQYFSVEFRPAVARVLASAIWSAWRREIGDRPDAGAQIRRRARFEFSRAVARRFFN